MDEGEVLETRYCTALSPLTFADEESYNWIHADAVEVFVYLSGYLSMYRCCHCGRPFLAASSLMLMR